MQLNFKTLGSGPALIILHGLFGSLDNWQTLAKVFAENYSVYLLDQRNHGKSGHSDDFDYKLMAQDLADFLDQQGIQEANFIGHSMGGKTVMQFGSDHTDRVDKMIVADIAPVTYAGHHAEILAALRQLPMDELTDRKAAGTWLEARIPEVGIRQFILKSLGRNEKGGFRWKFNFDSIDRNYAKILEAVKPDFQEDFPILFIRGAKSDYIKDEYFDIIREYYSNVKFETIEGAGHWLHADSPKEFSNLVLQFLNEA